MTSPNRPRILLVDDDVAMRRTFANVLGQTFEIVQAADGVEAIELLKKLSFDAIVTDLEMPRMSGDELVAWLEANQPDVAARVVVITGGAKRAEQIAWLGGRDPARVVAKPASVDDLVRAIGNALDARTAKTK